MTGFAGKVGDGDTALGPPDSGGGPAPTGAPGASPDRAATAQGIRDVAASLASLRRTAWMQLVLQRVGLGLSMLVIAIVLVGTLDYVLRLPAAVRLVLWAGGLVWVAWFVVKRVAPAWRFAPSLTDVALRLEATPAANAAGLRGFLASGLELGTLAPAAGASSDASELPVRSASEAARRFTAMGRAAGLIDSRRLLAALGVLALALLPVLCVWLASPGHARIGTMRVLAPWAGAAWPRRTEIFDSGGAKSHPRGSPLTLRALLARSPRAPGSTQVEVSFRTIVTLGGSEQASPWRKAVLTWQGKRDSVATVPDGEPPREGEVFEMLLDPGVPAGIAPTTDLRVEYQFSSGDDETSVASVQLVEPPAIESAFAMVEPPAYAAGVLANQKDWVLGRLDLGRARDQRSRVGPVLAGSRVALELTFNKPLPAPGEGEDAPNAWLNANVPAIAALAGEAGPIDVAVDGARWTIAFTPAESGRMVIQPLDEHGIGPREEHAIALQVAPDAPASVAIIEPPSDESVLPTAVVEAIGEGRDDVALARVALRGVLAKAPPDSAGAPHEPAGPWGELAIVDATSAQAMSDAGASGARASVRAIASVSISEMGAASGDEVWLRAGALDVLAMSTGLGELQSATRRLRVITEAEFVEQIRGELGNLRESAMRLAEAQRSLAAERPKAQADPSQASAQRASQENIGKRLPPMEELAEQLAQRVQRNRLEDPSLEGMLADAKDAVQDAREASDDASAQLAALSSPGTSEERSAAEAQAGQAQERVEQALEDLAKMLDRGQDSWAVRRELERLLSEQAQVGQQTAAAGQQTRGLEASELGQNEREALERAARRQNEVAERTEKLIEQMEARAEQLGQTDAGQAEAMRRAAQKARNERVTERQRDAAEKTRENQTGAAQQQQARAQEALEDIKEELERSDQRQDEALRRTLADIEASLTQLIERQEAELARLAPAMTSGQTKGLDEGMIALHQNTLGVLEKAEAIESPAAARLADLIDAAAQSQSAATVALRASDLVEAETHERASLAKLREALEEARKLDEEAEDREADRKRNELRKVYEELLELQVVLRDETAPLLEKQLSRRDRVTARALGERQLEIAAKLEETRSSTAELADAGTFELAHRRLDSVTRSAAASLAAGEAERSVSRNQSSAVRTLQALVEALRDPKKNKDFRDEQNEAGGGGGGGGGGQKPPLIPPIAELRLLRAMQAEAMDLTREAEESGGGASDIRAAGDLQSELAKQGTALLDKLKSDGPTAPPEIQPGNAEPDEAEPEGESP
jgi:hypothetical protein